MAFNDVHGAYTLAPAPGRRVGAEVVRQLHVLILGVRLYMRLREGHLRASAQLLIAGTPAVNLCRLVCTRRQALGALAAGWRGASPAWEAFRIRADRCGKSSMSFHWCQAQCGAA